LRLDLFVGLAFHVHGWSRLALRLAAAAVSRVPSGRASPTSAAASAMVLRRPITVVGVLDAGAGASAIENERVTTRLHRLLYVLSLSRRQVALCFSVRNDRTPEKSFNHADDDGPDRQHDMSTIPAISRLRSFVGLSLDLYTRL